MVKSEWPAEHSGEHAFSPCTQEAEADKSLRSRTAWSIEQGPSQPGLHKET